MNMTIWSITNGIWVIWKTGAHLGWMFLGALLAMMSVAQLVWQFWRWIDDAEEREEGDGNAGGYISENERHRILYGNLFKGWPWEVEKGHIAAWWAFVILISGVIATVCVALWPIVVAAAMIYGLGQLARGSRRGQKTLTKILAALKNKSEKDHDHDDDYVPK